MVIYPSETVHCADIFPAFDISAGNDHSKMSNFLIFFCIFKINAIFYLPLLSSTNARFMLTDDPANITHKNIANSYGAKIEGLVESDSPAIRKAIFGQFAPATLEIWVPTNLGSKTQIGPRETRKLWKFCRNCPGRFRDIEVRRKIFNGPSLKIQLDDHHFLCDFSTQDDAPLRCGKVLGKSP